MLESKDMPMTFEQKVKIALIRSGITQKDLAKQLGITRQYFNAIIHGKRCSPDLERKILCLIKEGA